MQLFIPPTATHDTGEHDDAGEQTTAARLVPGHALA
jgi:hypothetical protein